MLEQNWELASSDARHHRGFEMPTESRPLQIKSTGHPGEWQKQQVSHLQKILRAGIADLEEGFEGGSCCRNAFPSVARFRVLEAEPE